MVLSGFILVVGVAGFFRHEMFNLTFPLAHNLFHLVSGVIAVVAGFSKNAASQRHFGLAFGSIYTLVAIAGFLGLHDVGPIQLGLHALQLHPSRRRASQCSRWFCSHQVNVCRQLGPFPDPGGALGAALGGVGGALGGFDDPEGAAVEAGAVDAFAAGAVLFF